MLCSYFKMEHKKNNRKTFKIKLIIALAIIVLITIIAINVFNKSIDSENELNGIFIYNENVKYEFNGKNKGAMYDGGNKYEYTYKINEDKITMDFKDEEIYDATYTFKLENNTLILIGGEGTTGGEYILKKEE